jgi:arylesterase/paraoxonase
LKLKLISKQAILLALVLGPFLYQRISLVLSLKDNAPGKIQSRSAFTSYEVKFAEQLRNCEDVILPEGLDGLAILSCDEGRDRWNTVMVSLLSFACLSSIPGVFDYRRG